MLNKFLISIIIIFSSSVIAQDEFQDEFYGENIESVFSISFLEDIHKQEINIRNLNPVRNVAWVHIQGSHLFKIATVYLSDNNDNKPIKISLTNKNSYEYIANIRFELIKEVLENKYWHSMSYKELINNESSFQFSVHDKTVTLFKHSVINDGVRSHNIYLSYKYTNTNNESFLDEEKRLLMNYL